MTHDCECPELRAEVERLRDENAKWWEADSKAVAAQAAEIERLRGALEKIAEGYGPHHNWCKHIARAALGDQLVDTNKVRGTIAAERERIAKIVEDSEVFCEHGCTDRIASLIRELRG